MWPNEVNQSKERLFSESPSRAVAGINKRRIGRLQFLHYQLFYQFSLYSQKTFNFHVSSAVPRSSLVFSARQVIILSWSSNVGFNTTVELVMLPSGDTFDIKKR